jgi:hypothetical protein
VVLHNAPPEHVKLSRVCVGRRINASYHSKGRASTAQESTGDTQLGHVAANRGGSK